MDNKQNNKDHDLPESSENESEEEIPLWLQGLDYTPSEDTSPVSPDNSSDDWIKELNRDNPEKDKEPLNEPEEIDTGGTEESLPDWITELSDNDDEFPFRGIDDEPTDEIPAEEVSTEEDEGVNKILEQPSDQQGFIEISDISLDDEEPKDQYTEDKISEEDFPDWLKEMVDESSEILTEDTEPVEIPDTPISFSADIEQGYPFPSDLEENAFDITDESSKEIVPKPEALPEIQADEEALEDFEEPFPDDDVIKTIQNDVIEEITPEQIEEEWIEEGAFEALEDEINEEGSSETLSKETVGEKYLDWYDEESIVADSTEVKEIEETVEDDSLEDSYEELIVKENIDETQKDRAVEITENMALADEDEAFNEDFLQEDTLEEVEEELIEEEPADWEEEAKLIQKTDEDILRISEDDTVPIRVDDLEVETKIGENVELSAKPLPSILEKAKQHLAQGEINKGLDIVDIYIEEKAYLDEIKPWLIELAEEQQNINHRLWTSLGDLALQQGEPNEASSAYDQAIKSLIQN